MDDRRSRLRWRSRCGLRELDILLARFIDTGFEALGEADLDAFEILLAQPSVEILAWLMDQREPEDPALARICARIRAHL